MYSCILAVLFIPRIVKRSHLFALKISVSSSLLITKFESYIQLPGIYDKFFIILKFELTNANAFHETNKTNSDQSTFLHEVWQ